jgi:hypothetical protein
LKSIPKIKNAIIITNPPYLTNFSAKRKKIYEKVAKYFESTDYVDLYLLALEKMLEAQDFVVAIVPETFLTSNFRHFGRLSSVSILEENCFHDTENPVCVACFDKKYKTYDKIKIYKNGSYLEYLGNLEKKRLKPQKNIKLSFNIVDGNIALRAVDGTNPQKRIAFIPVEKLDYDTKGIKYSSRLITIIKVYFEDEKVVNEYIKLCNEILEDYRIQTHDILMSPFKGNAKNGIRRRRLDYATARAIMEKAFLKIKGNQNGQLKFI